MKLKEFNFEIYTINPTTEERGWDIKFVSVFANTKEQAKEYLNKWHLFDCIILFNFQVDSESNHKLGDIVDSSSYNQYKLCETLYNALEF